MRSSSSSSSPDGGEELHERGGVRRDAARGEAVDDDPDEAEDLDCILFFVGGKRK